MSETALLDAVRDRIVAVCEYRETEVDVELDQIVPAMVGDVYVIVEPGGWMPGPNNDTCGGVIDELFSVNVTVIMRATKVPKDRRRNVLIENLTGLNARLRKIINAIHFKYEVNAAANATIRGGGDPIEGFIEPLRFYGMSRPTVVGAEVVSAKAGEMQAGIKRTVQFNKARRIQNIASPAT